MPDISIRINALIAYLFLGPIMLFAKKDTHLAHPYVREHAKRATIIMIIGIVAFILYRLLRNYLTFGIFGISLGLITVTLIMSITVLTLIIGAYRAYSGISVNQGIWRSFGGIPLLQTRIIQGVYTEEDKVRMIASFIPFIGIIIVNTYARRETIVGRKIGSLFMLIILLNIVFISVTITTLTLLITLGYIGLIVATAVQLFAFSRFLDFPIYDRIPTFIEFDAHIKAIVVSIYDFCRIAFGGQKGTDYKTQYSKFIGKNTQIKLPDCPYFTPTWLIGIPLVNLITIPSLWQRQYKEYIPLILQGFALTIFTILIVGVYGIGSQIGIFLLWPIITIIVESKKNILVRVPLTSIMVDIYELVTKGQQRVEQIKKEGQGNIKYTYETEIK